LSDKITPKVGIFILDEQDRLQQFIDLDALIQKLSKTKNIACSEVLKNPKPESILSSVREKFQAGQFNRILWVGRFPAEQKKALESELGKAGLNPYLNEWCDLEEQGIRSGEGDRAVKTQKAMVIVQMAVARTRLLEPLEPLELPGEESVLIIGAGVAGLHAAVTLTKLGKKVHLVEKESGVGGRVASLRRLFPRSCDPHCGLDFAIQKLSKSPLVKIHTLARIKGLEGGPGHFEAKIEKKPRYVNEFLCHGCGECRAVCKAIHPAQPLAFPPAFVIDRQLCPPGCRECEAVCPVKAIELDQQCTEETVKAGAVLVTTGWEPYPLSRVEAYGYGRYPHVVSNLEMESLIEESPEIKVAGFIQCAGSRDEGHLTYCSAVCCTVTMKQVIRLKEKWPQARCYIFYQDIRTPGFDEALYKKVKSLDQVFFFRGSPATVRPVESGGLRVRLEDTLTGSEVSLDMEIIVLAGGMVPAKESAEAAQVLTLPLNEFGFFESHAPCHPEESQRTGIRVGGACWGPMNIARSVESSHRAAMDILPFLNETILVEPRIPVLNLAKCDKCKRCMEECPFSSFSFDGEGFPALDAAKCRQCGSCMGACPLAAISMRHFTIQQTAAQIKAMKPSFIGKEEPAILAFLCQNDAYQAAKNAAEQNLPIPPNVIVLKVPCAGAINNALIADAISFGIDGVLIGGCRDGQCHYVKGNELVQTRSVDLGDKLKKMFIEPERVRFEQLEIRDSRRYVDVVRSYVEELRRIGPNPFKN
jgi:heterodisulfide reductase subunit A/quinone-modifying oxidoreductase subunit QmoB